MMTVEIYSWKSNITQTFECPKSHRSKKKGIIASDVNQGVINYLTD